MRHNDEKPDLDFVDYQMAHAAIDYCLDTNKFGLADDLARKTLFKLARFVGMPAPLTVCNDERSNCDDDVSPTFEEALQNGDAF